MLEETDLIFEVIKHAMPAGTESKRSAGSSIKATKVAKEKREQLLNLLNRGFESVDTGSPIYKKVKSRKEAAVKKIQSAHMGNLEDFKALRKEIKGILQDVKGANKRDQTRLDRVQGKEKADRHGKRKAEHGTSVVKIKKNIEREKTNIAVAKKNIENLKAELSTAKSGYKTSKGLEKEGTKAYKSATRQRMKDTGYRKTKFKKNVKKLVRGASAGAGKFNNAWKNKVKGMAGNPQNENFDDDE